MSRLDAEKERNDQILYQLLPKTVAEKMRAGMDPLTCCEVDIVFLAYAFFFIFYRLHFAVLKFGYVARFEQGACAVSRGFPIRFICFYTAHLIHK